MSMIDNALEANRNYAKNYNLTRGKHRAGGEGGRKILLVA
jgi:hypothetical protein